MRVAIFFNSQNCQNARCLTKFSAMKNMCGFKVHFFLFLFACFVFFSSYSYSCQKRIIIALQAHFNSKEKIHNLYFYMRFFQRDISHIKHLRDKHTKISHMKHLRDKHTKISRPHFDGATNILIRTISEFITKEIFLYKII